MSPDAYIILTAHDDGVATITLNRPERRNGVTVELCRRLYDAVRDVAAAVRNAWSSTAGTCSGVRA